MEKSQAWYIEERAEQLAFVYLSRRPDLDISKQDHNRGIDLLINLVEADQYTGKMFGVQVKAYLTLTPTQDETTSNDTFHLNLGNIPFLEDIPFPLCLFVFAMENDEGYYRWLKAPIIKAEGQAALMLNNDDIFKPLTNEALADIVTQVKLWYEQPARQVVEA